MNVSKKLTEIDSRSDVLIGSCHDYFAFLRVEELVSTTVVKYRIPLEAGDAISIILSLRVRVTYNICFDSRDEAEKGECGEREKLIRAHLWGSKCPSQLPEATE